VLSESILDLGSTADKDNMDSVAEPFSGHKATANDRRRTTIGAHDIKNNCMFSGLGHSCVHPLPPQALSPAASFNVLDFLYLDYLAAGIIAAVRANVMGQTRITAIVTLDDVGAFYLPARAPFATTRLRVTSFGKWH
jgi:hypothetical protein